MDPEAMKAVLNQFPADQRARLKKAIGALAAEDNGKQKRNILILCGPPGGGKGTYGPKIVDKLGVPTLSTGDMLRKAVADGTETGKQADAVMKSGAFVSDEIVCNIIRDRTRLEDCAAGFILDGFPRTLAQAVAFDQLLAAEGEAVTSVICLEVPEEVLVERICGRWVCKDSGRSYHTKFKKPKSLPDGATPSVENMLDDETNNPLMQRADDNQETFGKRLDQYKKETMPILDHYTKVVRKIDASDTNGRTMEIIWAGIEAILNSFQQVVLTSEQLANVRKAFDAIDTNKSGTVEAKEFKAAMKTLDVNVTDEEVTAVFKGCDVNGDSKIQFDEYVKLIQTSLATPRATPR